MKATRSKFSPVSLLATSGIVALSVGVGLTAFVPSALAAKGAHHERMGGVPPRLMADIEAKLGKPLTDDQKAKINTAATDRAAAMKASEDKFKADLAAATGLTVDDITELMKPKPRAPKAAAAPAP